MRPSLIVAVAVLSIMGLAPAMAQTAAYVDDRSDPAALVRSLYNAIDRHEYARAWSYFVEPPAASFAAYESGYDDTEHVEIRIGAVTSDCGAGTCRSEVPVILRATDTAGRETVFSGCYLVSAVNAGAQTPPFRPLGIVSGRLAIADPAAADFPTDCGGGPGNAPSPGAAAVTAIFLEAYGDRCGFFPRTAGPADIVPEIYPLTFRYDGEAPTVSRPATLYSLPCTSGAYNFLNVFYLEDEYGEIRQLFFATPKIDVVYADAESTRIKSIAVRGFVATDQLGIPEFDPVTQSIRSFLKWRGLGDAWETGIWVFENGDFRLDHFEVDPTYNGEQDPVVIVEGGRVAL